MFITDNFLFLAGIGRAYMYVRGLISLSEQNNEVKYYLGTAMGNGTRRIAKETHINTTSSHSRSENLVPAIASLSVYCLVLRS